MRSAGASDFIAVAWHRRCYKPWRMWLYRILFAFDVLVVLVLGYFFVDGLEYAGPESAVIWLPILAVPIAVLIVAALLRGKDRTGIATILLAVLAVPPALFAAFFALIIASAPSWN